MCCGIQRQPKNIKQLKWIWSTRPICYAWKTFDLTIACNSSGRGHCEKRFACIAIGCKKDYSQAWPRHSGENDPVSSERKKGKATDQGQVMGRFRRESPNGKQGGAVRSTNFVCVYIILWLLLCDILRALFHKAIFLKDFIAEMRKKFRKLVRSSAVAQWKGVAQGLWPQFHPQSSTLKRTDKLQQPQTFFQTGKIVSFSLQVIKRGAM